MRDEQIPLVDFTDPSQASVVRSIGEGLERFGFVAVEGHGVSPDTLARAYRLAASLFALPPQVKARYETPEDGRQRGYTSFGVEHARQRRVGDLKEFWHVGRRLPASHPLVLSGDVPANQVPVEIAGFAEALDQLYEELERFGNRLLRVIGAYLGLEPGFFDALVHEGNSVLRVIHYPPLPAEFDGDAVRAAEHEDINLVTVLPVSTQPGLELLTRDGKWLEVAPPPGVLVCDTGDMMALLTGGRLPATTHRVVNPRQDRELPRYSMPFFLHPHPDRLLAPLRGDAPPVKARDFLHARLVEIGVASDAAESPLRVTSPHRAG